MKKSIEDLDKIRAEKREELDLRVDTKYNGNRKDILVCHGTGCTSSKSPEILKKLRDLLKEKNIENVNVVMVGCLGLCSKGPVVIVRPEDTFYSMVTVNDCEEIIDSHIVKGEIVERLLCKSIDSSEAIEKLDDQPF